MLLCKIANFRDDGAWNNNFLVMILYKKIYLSCWLVLSLFRMDIIMKEVIKVIGQKVMTS